MGQGRVQSTGCPGLSGNVPSCRDPVTPGLPSSLHRPAVGGLLREYMTSSFLGRRDFPQVTAEAAQAQRGDPMRPVRPHGWSRGELGFGFRAEAQGTPELSRWRSHTCGWEAIAPSQSCRGAAGAFVQPLHSLSLSFPIRRRQGRPCFSPSPPGAAWKADPGLAIPSPRSRDCLREPPPWRLCPASVSPAKSQAQLQVAGFGGGRLPRRLLLRLRTHSRQLSFPRAPPHLGKEGCQVHEAEMDPFLRAGGGAGCWAGPPARWPWGPGQPLTGALLLFIQA